MKNLLVFVVAVVALFGITNCEQYVDADISEYKQRIFFQYEYLNNAWGHSHSGWLIDSSGMVLCYDLPEKWFFPDSLGSISAAKINSNIIHSDSPCFIIDKNELSEKVKLIAKASEGKISEPKHEMYDAGVAVFSAFTFNKNTESYKQIILKQTGDFSIENSAPEADTLYNWMLSINQSVKK